jgi:SNF family Na+-dependent transporter
MKKLLIKIWNGNLEMVKTFWLVNILGSIIVGIPLLLGDIYYDHLNELLSIIILLFIILYCAYFVFATVATWRSSTIYINQKKKKKLKPFWGYAVKTVVVLSVLRSFGSLVSFVIT